MNLYTGATMLQKNRVGKSGVPYSLSCMYETGNLSRSALYSLACILGRGSQGGAKHLIVPQHFPDVGAGFSDARNFVVFDSVDPGVIGRQGQGKIALVEVQQMPQLPGPPANILDGIVRVTHT